MYKCMSQKYISDDFIPTEIVSGLVILYIKLKLFVGIYMCVHACRHACVFLCMYVHLQLEKVSTNLSQIWHAYSLKLEKDFRKIKGMWNYTEFKSQ